MINLARQDRVRSYLEALRQAAKVVDDRKKVLQQTGPADAGAGLASRRQSRSQDGNAKGACLEACPLRCSGTARSPIDAALLRQPLRLALSRVRRLLARRVHLARAAGCRCASSGPMIASCVSVRLRLNSRIPLPIEAPTSGSRLAPKSSSTTTMISMISVKPRLPTGTP